jgi:endonuclease III
VNDKYSIDVSVDVQVRRTFERLRLIRKGASNDELIYAARELNPTYPGVVDLSAWEIGRNWCRPRVVECEKCYMQEYCPTAKAKK